MDKLDREGFSTYRELAEFVGIILAKRWRETRGNTGSEADRSAAGNNPKSGQAEANRGKAATRTARTTKKVKHA
jgi:hypothetical protein